jgi:hypothetical protein
LWLQQARSNIPGMKHPTRIRSFRFDGRVLDALGEVARVDGGNPNRVAERALKAWLAAWLSRHVEKSRHRPAHGVPPAGSS